MSNRVQFGCIDYTQEHTVTPGNAQERTGLHGKDVIMSDKGHLECQINAQTSIQLPSVVVVADVLFCGNCLNKNITPTFLTQD